MVKKILDYPGIFEFKQKRPPQAMPGKLNEFDCYTKDGYIDCGYT
ncbi:MAG: hypothetical protein WC549_08930 [Actinomycetota bacterium]